MAAKKESAQFSLNGEDAKKIAAAFAYSFAAAAISGLIAVFAAPDVDLPAWMVPLVPAINAFLYGAYRFLVGSKE